MIDRIIQETVNAHITKAKLFFLCHMETLLSRLWGVNFAYPDCSCILKWIVISCLCSMLYVKQDLGPANHI